MLNETATNGGRLFVIVHSWNDTFKFPLIPKIDTSFSLTIYVDIYLKVVL